jgi:hypothetical protein
VRVGIKDWLVHFSSYKKLLIVVSWKNFTWSLLICLDEIVYHDILTRFVNRL